MFYVLTSLQEKQAQADQKKAKFHQAEGDHLTLLQVCFLLLFVYMW
jgi:hypothetical protein